ncbi:hypothetical protein [Breoghania sp.]|uniref:hypothetical protein n=1 Tax=Breoghania sp. TaxID=2065378 RepID=UPI002618FAA2|nr:hypothetical protein [Breoghania sp.]MDJ0930813.1 hypothetical protein [Breoghania sp.]
MRSHASGLYAFGLAGLLITTSPALAARQGSEIVAGWFEDMLSAGAVTADYGEIRQDGNETIVDNVDVKFSFNYDFHTFKNLFFEFEATSPEIRFTGLTETDKTFSAKEITSADGLTLDFKMATFLVKAKVGGRRSRRLPPERLHRRAPERPRRARRSPPKRLKTIARSRPQSPTCLRSITGL